MLFNFPFLNTHYLITLPIQAMKAFLSFFLLLISAGLRAQHINTMAGDGTVGFGGDNNPATAASMNGPYGVAVDALGNVYFADRANHRVRKINTAGIITTIGGTGLPGFSGDNAPATDAQINDPNGVAVDAGGNVYVTDRANNRVRRISITGVITTVAGNGSTVFNGDGIPATDASVISPRGVAVDAIGNIYIADQGYNRVRKVNHLGIISTIAGTGVAGFFGDNGPATNARLAGPYSIAIDGMGNVFVADVDNERIRRISPTGIIKTVAGTGTASYNGDSIAATAAHLFEPIGVAVNSTGDLFIADAWNQRVRKVTPAGVITTVAGTGVAGFSGDGGSAVAAQFKNIYGIAINSNGNIIVSDNGNNRIRYLHTPVGVENVEPGKGINVYPNPSADGRFKIDLSSLKSEQVTIVVTDMMGREVYKESSIDGQLMYINAGLVTGIYMVSVRDAVNIYKRRLFVSGK
ncbi:hypothetical protein CJD36_009050 [Flavipsychrobacter stenotrophus]|uniref:Uncharacterized protein n=2 Tax=Flavipsychrobacter stenotrophus TaxID=2077091 RepID=A0A2S7SYD4_9BACT|nr:hypothetical protein CJD36_009050 [Flavipsychrobacter stenotrophus]